MKKYIIFLLVCLFLFTGALRIAGFSTNISRSTDISTVGITPAPEKQGDSLNAVWVIIDQVSIEDIFMADTPNIDYLQQRGAFSLINVRTAGQLHSESTYLSAGAGNRCQGSKMSHIGIVYGKGALNDKITKIIEENEETNYKGKPGLLGNIAAENDIKIGLLGNNDYRDEKKRTAVSMLMNENGFVPYADIGNDILEKTDSPWIYQTDFQKLKDKFYDYKKNVDFLLVESGDLSRIEDFYQEQNERMESNIKYNKEDFLKEKKAALERIDRYIGFLVQNINLDETQLAIVVPTPPSEMINDGEKLSWLLISGRGIDQGWLSSTSTRRKGIITISDIVSIFARTNFINSKNYNLTDIKFFPTNRTITWDDLRDLKTRLTFVYNLRSPFIKGFIFTQIIILLLAIVMMIWDKFKKYSIFYHVYEYLLLALLLVPINYMLVSLHNYYDVLFILILIFIFTVLEELVILYFIKSRVKRIVAICTVIVLLIIFDLFNEYQMLADTILGYSSVIGARYYGIGNEYMGIFLGSFLIVVSILIDKIKSINEVNILTEYILKNISYFVLILFIIIIYLIGSVNKGANFGGMITALLACGVTYYYITEIKPWIFAIIAFLIPLSIILVDYSGVLGFRSHIGQAFAKIVSGEWQWLSITIMRKLSMNLKLLRWTIWTRVLLAMIVYLFVLIKRPLPRVRKLFCEYPSFKAGFYGTLVGSVITMFVNDSGVVAAATILFYPLMSLLYLIEN